MKTTDTNKIRYYLHGDFNELTQKFYCLKCDLFCEKSHFQKYDLEWGLTFNEDLFSKSLRTWRKISHQKDPSIFFRPKNAKNIYVVH